VRFEVLTAVGIAKLFWVVTPCRLKAETNVSEKHTTSIFRAGWYLPTSLRGVTTQKSNIDNFTAVKTSNLIHMTTFRA
jgi:hypothetical protein